MNGKIEQKLELAFVDETPYIVDGKKVYRYTYYCPINPNGFTEIDLTKLNARYAWLDYSQSYSYSSSYKSAYPICYNGGGASIFPHIEGAKKLSIDTTGDWSGYNVMVSVLFYG